MTQKKDWSPAAELAMLELLSKAAPCNAPTKEPSVKEPKLSKKVVEAPKPKIQPKVDPVVETKAQELVSTNTFGPDHPLTKAAEWLVKRADQKSVGHLMKGSTYVGGSSTNVGKPVVAMLEILSLFSLTEDKQALLKELAQKLK